jgi:hypothetical protein
MHRQSAIENHTTGHVQNRAVHAFGFPVGRWIVGFGALSCNACTLAKEVDVRVFASTIGAENAYAAVELSLKMTHKVFKLLGRFILRLR